MEINKEYSFKAFPYRGLSFKDRKPEEFNNSIIKGSCFYQCWEEGDKEIVKDIFPDGMEGVRFEGCNLDNVYVDEKKNTIVSIGADRSTHKVLKRENDLDIWVQEKINDKWIAREPLNKERRIECNLNIDPKNIPSTKITEEQQRQMSDILLGVEVSDGDTR